MKFHYFLSAHRSFRGRICEADVSLHAILPNMPAGFRLTQFAALDDMYLYAQLVSEALRRCCHPTETVNLIDLGAGSCAPTVKALQDHSRYTRVQVIAVDCDPHAISIGQENVRLTGLSQRYQFVQSDMLAYLRQLHMPQKTMICANPPYLPLPTTLPIEATLPTLAVNGGTDGDVYLAALLSHNFPIGTPIALQWSSLSNPTRIIHLIREHYEVLAVVAHETPFGSYTGSEPIRLHLLAQRAKGRAVFNTKPDGSYTYYFVGTILRRVR